MTTEKGKATKKKERSKCQKNEMKEKMRIR